MLFVAYQMFADKEENMLNQHFKQNVEIHPHNSSCSDDEEVPA